MSATTNWAGNVAFSAEQIVRPASVEELQELVAHSPRVRALGTGHSFSTVADTTGVLVSLSELPRVVEIDAGAHTVRVGAAVRFGELADLLEAQGFALHNLGSLPHISVAGACSTGTHGSGVGNGNLSSAVVALEVVRPDGTLARVDRSDPDFAGSVVALGSLGVVTTLTFALVPSFSMRQYVYDGLSFDAVVDDLAAVMGSAYSISAFLDWRTDRFSTTFVKKRSDEPDAGAPAAQWLGGRLADGARHCIEGMPVENATQQLGVLGPWHERLPHFRMEFTPSNGDEIQSEYMVDAAVAPDALRALYAVREQLAPAVQISEIRAIAPDELWMSPSYQRQSIGLHFTWVSDEAVMRPALRTVERAIAAFDARPHWGKVFEVEPARVRELTPRIQDFEALVRKHDPEGRLRNAFVDTYLELD